MKKLLLIFLLIAAWSVQAREVYPLCDDWLFSFRYENSSDNARCVTLPHTWNLDALAGTIPYLRTTADHQLDLRDLLFRKVRRVDPNAVRQPVQKERP